ncbi:MAG TPA: hypothetical protein IAC67_03920 [Candidatus Coproplasma excrementipullorum]|nr:hypothetical protein [Candidatus Coproplasma excrementipullorum]
MNKFCLKGSIKAVTYKLRLCAVMHGGGRVMKSVYTPDQLAQAGTFKLSGRIKDVTFFLKFCAMWFGGRAIADVPPEELAALKKKIIRVDRKKEGSRW